MQHYRTCNPDDGRAELLAAQCQAGIGEAADHVGVGGMREQEIASWYHYRLHFALTLEHFRRTGERVEAGPMARMQVYICTALFHLLRDCRRTIRVQDEDGLHEYSPAGAPDRPASACAIT